MNFGETQILSPQRAASSHMWLWGPWNVHSVAEELDILLYFMSITIYTLIATRG